MTNTYNSLVPKISKYNDYTYENPFESLFTSLIALLSTPKGSHSYDMEYGTNLHTFLFRSDTGNLDELIEEDIKNSIKLFIPELYPRVFVKAMKENHPSGIGFVFKILIVVDNIILTFDVTKDGKLRYKGSVEYERHQNSKQ